MNKITIKVGNKANVIRKPNCGNKIVVWPNDLTNATKKPNLENKIVTGALDWVYTGANNRKNFENQEILDNTGTIIDNRVNITKKLDFRHSDVIGLSNRVDLCKKSNFRDVIIAEASNKSKSLDF